MVAAHQGTGLSQQLLADLLHQHHFVDVGKGTLQLLGHHLFGGEIGGGAVGSVAKELEAVNPILKAQGLDLAAVVPQMGPHVLVQYLLDVFHCRCHVDSLRFVCRWLHYNASGRPPQKYFILRKRPEAV